MKRYTRDFKHCMAVDINGTKHYQEGIYIEHGGDKKLFDLENIEKELGIDLIIIFKALKNGIYDKSMERNVLVFLSWHDHLKEIVLFYDDKNPYYNGCYKFKDYGKTWALTKEELEKDEV